MAANDMEATQCPSTDGNGLRCLMPLLPLSGKSLVVDTAELNPQRTTQWFKVWSLARTCYAMQDPGKYPPKCWGFNLVTDGLSSFPGGSDVP